MDPLTAKIHCHGGGEEEQDETRTPAREESLRFSAARHRVPLLRKEEPKHPSPREAARWGQAGWRVADAAGKEEARAFFLAATAPPGSGSEIRREGIGRPKRTMGVFS